MSFLTVDHLTIRYAGAPAPAVNEVSFAVEPGEVFALVGESGSGKSSLALALTRLLPQAAAVTGQVVFEGADLLRCSADHLRQVRGGRIAYVFQDPASSLNPVLTIGEQLVEVMTLHDSLTRAAAWSQAGDWLERVQIPSARPRLRSYPHELSGGMQQRVMLAMAMAARPAMVVADEPTTALDVVVQVQILRLLRELQQQLQLAVLLISHDLLVVQRLAGRVGVLTDGQLVELGLTDTILRHPTHPATRRLLRARPLEPLQGRHG